MIEAQVQPTATGAIVFDSALGIMPGAEWFDRAHWIAHGAAAVERGGRGGVVFVETPAGACALRHYHRGGLAARVSSDSYLWSAAERTRAFREFRLLARLADAGLPVSAPVAARYERHGFTYRADLLTRRIAAARTLAMCLHDGVPGPELGTSIGRTIARFHAFNVWHADLNAHNILIDGQGVVWLIDFDRGRIRAPRTAWRRSNLARLHRSLDKIGASDLAGFDERFWNPLLAAYRAALVQGCAAQPGGVLT
jgi:3-deoxy-D-manno-octulosonic acid kinase